MEVPANAWPCERRRGGKGQHKSTGETKPGNVAFHGCIPFTGVSPPADLNRQLDVPTVRHKADPCDIVYRCHRLRLSATPPRAATEKRKLRQMPRGGHARLRC